MTNKKLESSIVYINLRKQLRSNADYLDMVLDDSRGIGFNPNMDIETLEALSSELNKGIKKLKEINN